MFHGPVSAADDNCEDCDFFMSNREHEEIARAQQYREKIVYFLILGMCKC